ncbi:arginine decarboxylase, pyruvoyl-dependent [Patescibacteria group bacterium]|nr:arginine decarboxylase, pyruvoyl-dependent [Patescibacteria group bacterium]MBU4367651.1 arginine decarboxylase, pyruvoyl-dependent [Patescibacteria group bacterium]MBU4461899.1 arginine decarboxylase, pyruvoyl-dependent [Patescibacteria group bacterium]MCG2699970.1 arginine decarboxylase, pyruvoyl-dependent [Candidatus Parcubacteria bacterium]
MIPTKFFFTKGVGVSKERLSSFELALRSAGIEKFNLVSVSSILPPGCKRVPREKGLELLKAGEVVFTVLARTETNEPNRLIGASIGCAVPAGDNQYGYLSEHHSFGEIEEKVSDYTEDLAATMLATTLGIEFNPESAWDEKEKVFKMSGKIIASSNVTQTAQGNKNGLWTTVVAAAIFVP